MIQIDKDRSTKKLVSITTYECDENDQLIAVKDFLFLYFILMNFFQILDHEFG
jgi:hypothetical protein